MAVGAYEQDVLVWQAQEAEFVRLAEERRELIERRIYSDSTATESWLEEVLAGISWPRETEVSFEIVDEGRKVILDVDLPEVEDMPNKVATVPARG